MAKVGGHMPCWAIMQHLIDFTSKLGRLENSLESSLYPLQWLFSWCKVWKIPKINCPSQGCQQTLSERMMIDESLSIVLMMTKWCLSAWSNFGCTTVTQKGLLILFSEEPKGLEFDRAVIYWHLLHFPKKLKKLKNSFLLFFNILFM